MNRTDRLLAILLAFQAQREMRAEDLARRFEVSVRTVYRDVQALSEGGVPIAALPGKGYRLLDGYFLPPLSFTVDEAVVLALGGGFIRDRVDAELRRAADDALAKLQAILPLERQETVARRRREVFFPTFSGGPDERKLGALRAAIREHRVLRLLYHSPRRPVAEGREVEPVSLVYAGLDWHLAAYCRLREAPRLFKLNRIDRYEPLAERFTPSARHAVGPDTDDRHDVPEARVGFDPSVERWVRERQPFPFLREERGESGPVFVYALRDETELLGWVLSWGAAAEVLAPPALRRRLAAEAHAIAERHAAEPADDHERSPAVADSTVSGGPG